jgi:hypothetical protein
MFLTYKNYQLKDTSEKREEKTPTKSYIPQEVEERGYFDGAKNDIIIIRRKLKNI